MIGKSQNPAAALNGLGGLKNVVAANKWVNFSIDFKDFSWNAGFGQEFIPIWSLPEWGGGIQGMYEITVVGEKSNNILDYTLTLLTCGKPDFSCQKDMIPFLSTALLVFFTFLTILYYLLGPPEGGGQIQQSTLALCTTLSTSLPVSKQPVHIFLPRLPRNHSLSFWDPVVWNQCRSRNF